MKNKKIDQVALDVSLKEIALRLEGGIEIIINKDSIHSMELKLKEIRMPKSGAYKQWIKGILRNINGSPFESVYPKKVTYRSSIKPIKIPRKS
jgi:hypothetical protein